MKEQFDITALRLANLALQKSYSGQMKYLRQLAVELLKLSEPEDVQKPKALPVSRDPLGVHIRWMIRRDMPEIREIENHSFEFPWSDETFMGALRQRNCIGMVSESDERVVGYMIYEMHKTRLHLLNFAVHPEYRHRRVGSAMVNKLVDKLSHQRRNRMLLEIRESNVAGQMFWKALGFSAVSVMRDFYDDTTEDAYLMQYKLPRKSVAQ